MNDLFDYCVDVLYYIAAHTGLTYKEANIWIFVIIHPLITLILLVIVILSIKKNYRLHNLLYSQHK